MDCSQVLSVYVEQTCALVGVASCSQQTGPVGLSAAVCCVCLGKESDISVGRS